MTPAEFGPVLAQPGAGSALGDARISRRRQRTPLVPCRAECDDPRMRRDRSAVSAQDFAKDVGACLPLDGIVLHDAGDVIVPGFARLDVQARERHRDAGIAQDVMDIHREADHGVGAVRARPGV